MAAYVRLATRSQAKFQNNEIESHSSFHVHPHLRRAWYPPVVHFNSCLASVRLWIWHSLSQWPFPGISKLEKKLVCGWLVGLGSGRFRRRFWPRNSTLFSLSWPAVFCWHDGGVTWQVIFHTTTTEVSWLLALQKTERLLPMSAVPPQWGLDSLHTKSFSWCVQGLDAWSVASVGECSSREAETQGGCGS